MHKMVFLQIDNSHGVKVHKKAIIFNQENLPEKNVETEYIPCFLSADTESLNIVHGGRGNKQQARGIKPAK